MDARQERGLLLALAQVKRIRQVVGDIWSVPSQSQGSGGYVVNLSEESCTCLDYEVRRTKCKHQWAVEFSRTISQTAAGQTTVTDSVKLRPTYTQNWPAYNAAQCSEKATAQALLAALCEGIQTPPHPGRGPKPVPLCDVVFAMTMKVYTTVSGRRATTDLEECAKAAHIRKAPRYNTLFEYIGKKSMTPLLTTLVEESAAPLASIETQFAADSTGFGTSTYRRWYDHKYGREMKEHGWVKAHAMVGAKTNVITAIRVTDGDANDSPELPALLKATDLRFNMEEVSADKAYLSRRNLAEIEARGAVPYIPFKINSVAAGPAAWRRMWGLFVHKQEEFLTHYHQRSNVESTFSAVKRKFGGSVRSKDSVSQVNEILCKALCFNLSCLVHAIHEFKIEPKFPAAGVTQ